LFGVPILLSLLHVNENVEENKGRFRQENPRNWLYRKIESSFATKEVFNDRRAVESARANRKEPVLQAACESCLNTRYSVQWQFDVVGYVVPDDTHAGCNSRSELPSTVHTDYG
jgi:hypothetical protein